MNKILTWIMCFLAISVVKINCSPCKVFKCGTIKQTSGKPDICVDPGNSNDQVKIGKCNDSTHCQADGWNVPEEVSTSVCVKPSDDTPKDNSTAPGDVCKSKKQCFGLDSEKDCKDGKCVTTRGEGKTCEDIQGMTGHKWCQMGTFCKERTCSKQIEENKPCDYANECKFGLNCIALGPSYDKFTCTALHKLENGSSFSKLKILYNGKWTGYNSMCKSYHAIDIDTSTLECRAGDRNKEQTQNFLKKEGSGQNCEFTSYSGDFPELGEEASSVSKCGFNNITNGFCPKRKGDNWFIEAHKLYMSLDLTKLQCSAGSDVDNSCYDIVNIDPKVKETFRKALLEVDDQYGYQLVANNDACVAKSITTKFWMGTHPDDDDSAIYFGSATIILAMILFLTFFS